PNVDPFTHSDFFRAKELIKVGEAAARNALPEIRTKINQRRIARPTKKITKRPAPIIRSINFQGNKTVAKSLLSDKLTIRTGDFLKFDKLISGLISIYYTDYFEHVDYRLEFPSPDSVDIFIELQEKPAGFYYLGVLYNNYDNVNLGLEVSQGNLAGAGLNVRGVMHLGNPNEFRFGIHGTRLFHFPSRHHFDGYWNSRRHSFFPNRDWLADYLTENTGGILEFGYILGKDAFFDFGFKVYQSISKKPLLPFFAQFPDKQWVIGPSFRLEFNNFNNYFFPTKGITYQLNGLYSTTRLGASKNFLKLNYFSEQVIKLTNWLLIHPGLEIGISWGELTLTEYYRTDGNNFIGFKKDELTTDQKAIARFGTSFKLFQLFKREDYPFYFQV
ncbi:MAG: hypothetical protein N2748_03760, partial [candidate division WOR-3 bacterium]|nr:hypothetical protein [candidate division WOR-3 bacterium]